ncbi:MAG: hypothetical protein HFI42_14170 [Lachnospiraceae bacterium]|nr:hypothetical protein [Lachnospiraceae bacterium]
MYDKKEKIFWGVFLILAAAFLIIGRLGFLEGFSLGNILCAVFLVAVLIHGIIKLGFGQILFSIAFLCIIFDEELGIEALTPWTVLIAALLGTIGLNMLFHKKKKKSFYTQYHSHHKEVFVEGTRPEHYQEADADQETVFCKSNFGSAIKYVNSTDFQYASLECSFGGMKVYFDNAVITGASATVDLDVSFAGVELYVPKEWNVVNNVKVCCAGIDEKGRNMSTGTPSLVLTGELNFGGVTVHYI